MDPLHLPVLPYLMCALLATTRIDGRTRRVSNYISFRCLICSDMVELITATKRMQSQRVSIEVFPSDKFTFTFIIVIISIAFCQIYRRLLISDLGNPDCVCQTYLTGRAYPALYVVCWNPLTGVLIYPIN